jgi:plastocyanin
MRARALVPALVLLLLLGCGGEASRPAVTVEANDGFSFVPARLTVALGTTVRWTNRGAIPHTVTSGASSRPADGPGAWLDRPLPAGGAVEFTFTTAGTHPYFCRTHEGMGMTGVVVVEAAGAAEPNEAYRRSRL